MGLVGAVSEIEKEGYEFENLAGTSAIKSARKYEQPPLGQSLRSGHLED